MKAGFFNTLTLEELARLRSACRVEKVKAGDIVMEQGQPARYLLVIATGSASMEVTTGAEVHVIDTLSPGACAGSAALAGAGTFLASIRMLTDGTVLVLNRERLKEQADLDPVLGCELMRNICHHLWDRCHRILLMLQPTSYPQSGPGTP